MFGAELPNFSVSPMVPEKWSFRTCRINPQCGSMPINKGQISGIDPKCGSIGINSWSLICIDQHWSALGIDLACHDYSYDYYRILTLGLIIFSPTASFSLGMQIKKTGWMTIVHNEIDGLPRLLGSRYSLLAIIMGGHILSTSNFYYCTTMCPPPPPLIACSYLPTVFQMHHTLHH